MAKLKILNKYYAFAKKPVNRRIAYSTGKAHHRLYRVEDVAEKLGKPVDEVTKALDDTGFLKLLRIRQELLNLKEDLRTKAIPELEAMKPESPFEIFRHKLELRAAYWMIENIRNILRVPR